MAAPDNRTAPWTFVLDEPLRILVVDDDPILREFACVYLATPAATIETACDGAAARTLLGQSVYDLVLLDIEMPHLDGFTLLEEMKANEGLRHRPVIMLTGHDDVASIDRAYQLGAHSFATKPVNWRQLSYQIRYVVRTSRTERRQVSAPALQPEAAVSPAEQTVRDFLQSIIRRADALEHRLSADERARFAEQLSGVRAFAQLAYAECCGSSSSAQESSAQESSAHESVADGRMAPDRRSVDVGFHA
jgi:DNA-binding response OmpR family regulator